jgi:hypothetical protein
MSQCLIFQGGVVYRCEQSLDSSLHPFIMVFVTQVVRCEHKANFTSVFLLFIALHFCQSFHIRSIVTVHFKICLFTYKLKIFLHQLSTISLTFSTVTTNHSKLHSSTATKHFLKTGSRCHATDNANMSQ